MVQKRNHRDEGFEVYKGLQAPLMFKGFKGRYIYIGAGFLMGGFIVAAALISLVGTLPGIITLCLIWTVGYIFISQKQKQGLHSKNREKGVFIVINKYKIRKLN